MSPYSLHAHLVISIFDDIELTYPHSSSSQPPLLILPQPRELMNNVASEGRALQPDLKRILGTGEILGDSTDGG